jgi:predicted Zn-dependent peptidase
MHKMHVLDNGIKVLTEEIPHLLSISIGVWVKMGSRYEDEKNNGISHFIEHLLFKGTERRSALDIAKEIDSVGGVLNAFTGREYTCFYAKVLSKDLPLAVDLLADVYNNPLFDSEELSKEKGVILQEIKMVEDTPDDLIHDRFAQYLWKDHPLGYPILGNVETVTSVTSDDVRIYFQQYHIPETVIISAAGNLKHEELLALVEKSFGKIPTDSPSRSLSTPTPNTGVVVAEKDLEQVHFCLGTTSLPLASPDRYKSYLLNVILGGGMSSRLFQEIREKRGLAYSVYSYLNSYADTGSLVVYAGTSSDATNEVLSLIMKEFDKLKEGELDDGELLSAKEQLKGNMLLGLESSESKMSKLAKEEIYFNRYIDVEEIMSEIDKVTLNDIGELARTFFLSNSLTLVALGKLKSIDMPVSYSEVH